MFKVDTMMTKPVSMGLYFIVSLGALAADSLPAQDMLGCWEGEAKIIVSWCSQKNLAVSIQVKDDGSVIGQVGDATLSKAYLRPNRGWLGRKLNLRTDYIITGKLVGAIVAPEGIMRARVKIPFNLNDGRGVGGLHTNGAKVGGKQRMALSATKLILKHRHCPGQ